MLWLLDKKSYSDMTLNGQGRAKNFRKPTWKNSSEEENCHNSAFNPFSIRLN